MPIKFKIRFKLEEPKPVEEFTPDRLHALFLSLFPEKIAEEFHKPARYRPFCIWFPEFFKSNQKDNLIKNFNLTISILKDEYFSPLLGNLVEKEREFHLGDTRIITLPYSSSLIQQKAFTTYEELYDNASSSPYFSFTFYTPVSFKKGKIDYPLPDPKIVFKSLIKKWNYFSPFKIDVDLREVIENKIAISYLNLKSHKIALSLGGKITGFTGEVGYYVKDPTHQELKWLNTLGRFSIYSGLGRKTTMGLGMVKFECKDKDILYL